MALNLEYILAAALSCGLIIILSTSLYKYNSYCRQQPRKQPPTLPFYVDLKQPPVERSRSFSPAQSPSPTAFLRMAPPVGLAGQQTTRPGHLDSTTLFSQSPFSMPSFSRDAFESFSLTFNDIDYSSQTSTEKLSTEQAPDDLTPLSSRVPSACYSQRPRAMYWDDSFYFSQHCITGDDEPAVVTALSPAVTRRPSQADSIDDDEPLLNKPGPQQIIAPHKLIAALEAI
ncbi:hypothetical protein CFIMG_007884RA00001 [Ceratocystis fimbriata CBS 114723]|uniref:Uncharacterized protein n=1 Tax=Ceratocystis fimbriata CBS 114723 TaxID=1035309 RepID=A0A2C5WU70_9PEZI|nr:hypothetical protein CFIMG_007884RA00001 [Ceratocystis fimbriata CBS 114723]